ANSRKLNLDAFLAQAAEYEEWDSGWDRLSRFFVELRLTHDFPVRRVHELTKWIHSGEYDRIIGGDYPKRGDDVDPRAAASDAVEPLRAPVQAHRRGRPGGGRESQRTPLRLASVR